MGVCRLFLPLIQVPTHLLQCPASPSLISSPSTPWWPSMSPSRCGRSSAGPRLPPPGSPSPRRSLALWSSTTSTAASTLGTGTRTRSREPSTPARSREVRLHPRLPHQPRHRHEGLRPHRPSRLGYSEVQLVQKMIDGVNTLYKEDKALREAHGMK